MPSASSPPSGRPDAIVVLAVDRTRVRLLAIAPDGTVLSSRFAPGEIRPGEPYPSFDVEHVWRWMMAALADLGERFRVEAIVPTACGAAAALVDETDLVLPVMDYEAEIPAGVAAAYAEVAPWFEECCCPILPAGRTLARQLFWQSRAFAEAFARVRWILPFAQYWGWGLSGIAASEVTSLGAQTQLWNPCERDVSGLARREGWAERLAPLRPAWSVLGPLAPELAARAGLPADTPVLTGIQNDGARLARLLAAGLDDTALVITGDTFTTFEPNLSVAALDPLRDTAAGTDLEGRVIACARFAGGREYAVIAGDEGLAEQPQLAEVGALIEAGTRALPSFAGSSGPFPGSGGRGRIEGPAPASARARAALASLYVALVTSAELDVLRSKRRVVVGGPLAERELFVTLLAALRPDQEVLISRQPEATAIGAALLWQWRTRPRPVALELARVPPADVRGLRDYAARWREGVALEPA